MILTVHMNPLVLFLFAVNKVYSVINKNHNIFYLQMGNTNQGKSSFEEHNWRKIDEKRSRVILYNDITMKSVERHEAVLNCDEG